MTLQITITSRSKQLSCLYLQQTNKSNKSLVLSLSSLSLSTPICSTTTTSISTTFVRNSIRCNPSNYSTTTSTTTPPSPTGSNNSNVGSTATKTTIKKNDKDVFQNASDFWSSLRYKVAMALTTSLSTTERDELLRRLKVNTGTSSSSSTTTSTTDSITKNNENDDSKNKEEEIVRQSIAEAVAIARIEEAQTLKNKWEKEKEQLLANMEVATQQRIENEIKLLQQKQQKFNQWQNDLLNETTTTTTITNTTIPEAESAVALSTTKTEASSLTENEQNQHNHHPLLGTMLFDLGYKRIYTVSASVLQTLPVWKKQRIYRHSRAKEMTTDKLKSLHLGFPGIISLYESTSTSTSTSTDADNNEEQANDNDNDSDTTNASTASTATSSLSIIDGQHRVGMMTMLQEKLAKQKLTDDESASSVLNFDHVLVEVYSSSYLSNNTTSSTTTEKEQKVIDDKLATELFLEVNKAEPVKLIDMPGIVKKSDNIIITNGATYLSNKYSDMFSSSQKCRIPNMNIDNLRDALYASNVLQRHTITTSKQLQVWLDSQNTKLLIKYTGTDAKTIIPTSVSKAALDKANKYQFYLGLESGWLYE